MTHKITALFPLRAILFSVIAYCEPGYFSVMKSGIVPLLGLVMLGRETLKRKADQS